MKAKHLPHLLSPRSGAIILASSSCLQPAAAADLSWDTTPGAVGPGNGTITGGMGTWNETNGNWTADADANNIVWVKLHPAEGVEDAAGGPVQLLDPIADPAIFRFPTEVLAGVDRRVDGRVGEGGRRR